MKTSRCLRFALLLLAAAAVLLLPAVALADGPPPTHGVRITRIGAPTWKPVDFHMFSAPLGTADTGYAEFVETALGLLPEPNHTAHPDLMVGPGVPHDPPYNREMGAGVSAQGYHQGTHFSRAEFSEGMGVWTTWMNVPFPGTTGSSPDFASGRIIANSLFPIHVEAYSTHNGAPFSTVFVGDVPALNAVNPSFDVDGASHFPFFLADNADFGPPGVNLRGSYMWQITMTDASGNGWRIRTHFSVAP